jgi:tetratricopeptide (TPR) repeat protein
MAAAWCGRGNAFVTQRRQDEAAAAYDRALELNPNLADAWMGRSRLFDELRDYNQSFAAYGRGLSLQTGRPEQAEAWLARGSGFYEQKRFDEAFAAYRRALHLNPDLAEAHFNEAALCLLVGDFPNGWEKFEWRWKGKDRSAQLRDFQKPLWLGHYEGQDDPDPWRVWVGRYSPILPVRSDGGRKRGQGDFRSSTWIETSAHRIPT